VQLITRAFFLGLGYFLHEKDKADKVDNHQVKLTSEFLKLVEANYREHRDLKFYAERMGLTPKYISTVIKASSERSAMEWIERYVTLDAIAQLTSTDRSIKYIAYDLNFPSLSFFGKYFTRVVGLSPSAYRAEHKKTKISRRISANLCSAKEQIKYNRRIAKREQ
jgi:AraC-like DNA-binding protein